MIWLLTGLALTVALYFNGKGAVALYGLIPVALGLAYLITCFAVAKKATGTERSTP
jgi:cadmium resistance protein CadD (predicted permease)